MTRSIKDITASLSRMDSTLCDEGVMLINELRDVLQMWRDKVNGPDVDMQSLLHATDKLLRIE